MPTENRSSNTDMISVPRDLAEEICNGLRITQERGVKELRAILAQPAEHRQGKPIMLTAVAELVDDGNGGLEARWLLEGGTAELFAGMTLLVADNAPDLCSEDGSAEVYTRADPGEVERLRDELPEFARTVIAKLQRFRDCAEDGQGADIGRRWFDVLVQLGLLHRVQRSPALWEITCEGDALLESRAALSYSAEPSAPVERDERASFEYHHRVCDLVRDEDCPEDYRNQSVQDSWEGWQARAALERNPS